jgi:hypothetical protein
MIKTTESGIRITPCLVSGQHVVKSREVVKRLISAMGLTFVAAGVVLATIEWRTDFLESGSLED